MVGQGETGRKSDGAMVGVPGFEPGASRSQSVRSNQAELHPAAGAP